MEHGLQTFPGPTMHSLSEAERELFIFIINSYHVSGIVLHRQPLYNLARYVFFPTSCR